MVVSNVGPHKRDNYGIMKIEGKETGETKLTFAGGTQQQSAACMLTSIRKDNNGVLLADQAAHAGDNYIIAAHPNNGVVQRAEIDEYNNIAIAYENENTGSGGNGNQGSGGNSGGTTTSYHHLTKTPLLTVWRTLWAELDQIALPPNNIVKADLPLIDGFVKSELARACIDIKPYTPNTTTWVSGLEIMPYAWNNGTSSIANACRNSPQPTETFWTVHMIGAFRGEPKPKAPTDPNPTIPNPPPLGRHYGGNNTIFVFNWQIENAVDTWNQNNPNQQIPSNSLGDIKRRTSLHEIGHALGLKDNVYGSGIMEQTNMGNRLLTTYQEFKPEELRDIQAQSKPK